MHAVQCCGTRDITTVLTQQHMLIFAHSASVCLCCCLKLIQGPALATVCLSFTQEVSSSATRNTFHFYGEWNALHQEWKEVYDASACPVGMCPCARNCSNTGHSASMHGCFTINYGGIEWPTGHRVRISQSCSLAVNAHTAVASQSPPYSCTPTKANCSLHRWL